MNEFISHNTQKLSKTRTARYALLKTRKGRRKEGLFIVQGLKAVRDTIDHFELESLILSGNLEPRASYMAEFLESRDAVLKERIFLATESEMKKISTLNDLPDIIAVYRIPVYEPTPKLSEEDEFILVLDGVSDPGNFGTIIRSAHWFGIKEIYCSSECPDLYNPKVVQSTMGSMAKVRVHYVDLKQLLEDNAHLPVYGLLLEGKDIFQCRDFNKGFIVMGNEGHGISEEIRSHITDPLTIPPKSPDDKPESLNVAIATAITLAVILS